MANLVIMESPSKANTVKGYLGSNYKVIATTGHVRDLPKSTLGIDIDNHFEAHYINIRGKGDLIKEIKKEAKAANKVFLATDPDREGEAIAWHLATALGIPIEKTQRVTFNEVTKGVVKSSIKQPRQIDMNIVNAQQARRLLDRIVGYKLSPLLWKAIRSGLSAGRVQSVATKIIVERENEIREFRPVEYWTIDAYLLSNDNKPFVVHFYGDVNGRIKIENEEQAMKIVNAVEGRQFTVASVKRSSKHKSPAPPFITSTLQQEASKKLGFQSSRTMKVAQELYEGINIGSENGGVQGLITYMRTDSLRISTEAQDAARLLIKEKYGDKYNTDEPRVYKSRSGAQDAHEAIRPVNVTIEPAKIKAHLTNDQFKLYKLIWERFISSQMQSALLSTLTVDFDCSGYIFRTAGYTVTFPGYMAVYEESEDESAARSSDEPSEQRDAKIPDLCEGEKLNSEKIDPSKHFTEPPPRYNEATLIKFLEDNGIGRPSTYATIITTIITRGYVKRDGKALVPTELGEMTNTLMNENFGNIVDYRFTANIETELDEIERSEKSMEELLSDFWADFSVALDAAEKKIDETGSILPVEQTDMICEKCGSVMVIKNGRYGRFAACPNYPACRNTKPLTDNKADGDLSQNDGEHTEKEKKTVYADFKCDKCGANMVLRSGKYGSFYACENYPTCKNTKPKTTDIGVACPECGAKVVTKYGRKKTVFYSCERYPECSFSSWDMPTNEKCPECGDMLMRKKGKALLVCRNKECKYSRKLAEEQTASETQSEE